MKKWGHLSGFMSLFQVMVLKLSKIVSFFCYFLLMSAKKSKSVTAIYVYVPQSSRFILFENGIACYGIYQSLENISV